MVETVSELFRWHFLDLLLSACISLGQPNQCTEIICPDAFRGWGGYCSIVFRHACLPICYIEVHLRRQIRKGHVCVMAAEIYVKTEKLILSSIWKEGFLQMW